MRVFKFGGASIKNAGAIKNMAEILSTEKFEPLVVVISAIGKTTNAFEDVVASYLQKDKVYKQLIFEIKEKHLEIVEELFPNKNNSIYKKIEDLFAQLILYLSLQKSERYDFVYDQVVGYGELLSTHIVSSYLSEIGIANQYRDARKFIKTDTTNRKAKVDWTNTRINFKKLDRNFKMIITQGFIGSDNDNFTTTLGREGSDFTAAIFASCLDAEEVVIWKNVPGILNADPRLFENTVLLEKLSYEEIIELSYYGASVIHSKTLKPLQQKDIPLRVKSFIDYNKEGTQISSDTKINPLVPNYIVKKEQTFMELFSLEYAFILESAIIEVIKFLKNKGCTIRLVENEALTMYVCFEDTFAELDTIRMELKKKFQIRQDKKINLYTVRHYNNKALSQFLELGEVLLKRQTKDTFQIIISS